MNCTSLTPNITLMETSYKYLMCSVVDFLVGQDIRLSPERPGILQGRTVRDNLKSKAFLKLNSLRYGIPTLGE
ncbi:unnamed protein product [Sphenostylis stenocarpa]|uniref:Uncharacterized protein n=1 Tax=Sphenostylis stenocarpa TaxID=92480 RepID=A0AA86SJB0_9FABA|nr:unnamed protein product [Sphenostylis stenocarpa]